MLRAMASAAKDEGVRAELSVLAQRYEKLADDIARIGRDDS